MPTALTQKINETLLKNPKLVEVLFQDIFGKYLLRYYGEQAQKFSVQVNSYEDTSYMNFETQRISIAMNSIVQQLTKGINVYAVAYHELAHILYTHNDVRDTIRERVLRKMYDDKYGLDPTLTDKEEIKQQRVASHTIHEKQVHMLWNVIEDERIERILMREYTFLVDIVDPLKTIIQDDGKIMSWRLGKYASKTPDATIAHLCEHYIAVYNQAKIVKSKTTGRFEIADKNIEIDLSNTLYEIHKLMFPPTTQPPVNPPKPKKRGKGKSENKTQGGDEPVNNNDDKDDDKDDDNNDNDNKGDDKKVNNKQDDKAKAKSEKREDELNKQLEKQIAQAQELIETVVAEQDYLSSTLNEKRRVSVHDDPIFKNMFIVEIPLITQQRTTIRGGITQAQRKSFKSDISPKINVSRLVETMSNKSEPKVFYSKGKDASFLRKVVIFEDVSSSTYGGGNFFSPVFSMIAYALAKSFDDCDWWIYGDLLAKKHKQDFCIPSTVVGTRYNMAMSTNASYLANVMRKYAKEKALFVVITDGDIQSLTRDNKLFQQYVNQTAFIGYLKYEDQKILKHKCVIDEKLARHMDMSRRDMAYQIRYDHATQLAENWLKKQPTHNEERFNYFKALHQIHASKNAFDAILKDAKMRQYVVDAVKTITSVMKGSMK
jgi:hypothetical protein